ncbi:T9SS type A sorting domain-containing protein [Lacinutrix sp. 5H-3-7-4]|uniref:T9SS type A sorting domain-containing protein n=1 Tax=Lacinutrix sp. (strain 5H-3-7-4) TaxID=983544 RepID=UPI00020A3CAD|nr:T9SS type A sorting domain-containing protein [Lacinutrix sp. 5H-3-7-4]AEH02797.1 Fibronectin type III domain protein [Lacinutrix sp. 5H-3-7-4]
MKKITLFTLLMFSVSLAFAQVGFSEDFDSGTPAGWTDSYANTGSETCSGSSERDNLYSGSASGNLTSPNYVGQSNGTDLTVSFDYKVVNWSAATVATAADFGTAELQYSLDDGTTWTTVLTIDDTNHVVANTCATMMAVIPAASLPSGSDVKIQIANTWNAGDYYFYVDNFDASQVVANPPNCDALLTETTNVSVNGDISWSVGTGVPTGYFITAGSTMGGTDLADNVDNMNSTSYSLGALMAGTTYYVTITPYNDNGSATGCTEQSFTTFVPPANDECENAIALTVNEDTSCGTVTSATTQYATASPQPDDATGTPNTDVWFTFVATATNNNIEISNVVNQGGGTSTSTDMGMSVFDDAAGCNMTATNEVGESDPNTLQLSGLIVGNTYYVRVYGWSTTVQYNNFDICVGTPPAPPENDDCDGAIAITPSADDTCANAVSGSTQSAAASSSPACTGGKDVWYSFVAAEDGEYIASVTETFESGFASTYFSAYEGACDALVQVGSSTSCFNTGDLTIATVAGQTYFISVRSSSTTNYVEFDLCVYPKPAPIAGQLCETAIDASTLPFSTTDDTANYFDDYSGSPGASCSSTSGYLNGDDVVYSYTATEDAVIAVDLTNIGSTYAGVFVYADCADIGTTCLDGATNLSSTADLSFDFDAVSGETYYIVISTWASPQATTYTLDITNASLSVDEFENNTLFSYYPNPVKNTLTLNAQKEISSVNVVNMLGQTVLKTTPNAVSNELDMSSLKSGAYFVQVTVGNAVETVKIIKN